jgi:hypothetical protein
MGFDLSVFISAGIQDASSPMQFAVAGVYAVMLLCLRHSRKWVLFTSGGLFIAVFVIMGAILSLGIFDGGATGFAVSWFFLVMGAFFLILGFLFLREWHILRSGAPRKFAAFIPTPPAGMAVGLALSFCLALGLAFLSNIWPVNYQVLVQGVIAFTPGKFFDSLGALCVYVLFRSGAAFFLLLFFILAQRKENAGLLHRKRSLLAVIASAFYFALGGSLVFLFYVSATKPWL